MNKNNSSIKFGVSSNALYLLPAFFILNPLPASCNSKINDSFGHFYTTADSNQSSRGGKPNEGVLMVTRRPETSIDISENAKYLSIPDHIAVQRTLSKNDLYNLKAEAFYNKGLRSRSIEIWEQILQKTPNHLPSMNNLAMAYFNERRFKETEALYRRLIELDSRSWTFPEARFFGPMAYYQQYGDLGDTQAVNLTEFLNNNPKNHRAHAEKLRLIAVNRVSSNKINRDQIRMFRDKLARYERNIVHFWAEWCRPCLEELKDLFEFRFRYPDIHYSIVSIDSEHDKNRSDRRLNDIFSPYKPGRNDKIGFLLDNQKLLWKTFIPLADQQIYTVPRTLFLKGTNPVNYSPRQVDWKSLDVETIWERK